MLSCMLGLHIRKSCSQGWQRVLWQSEVTAGEGADAGLPMLAVALEADQDAVGVDCKHLGGDARVAHPARTLLRRHHAPLHQLHAQSNGTTQHRMPPVLSGPQLLASSPHQRLYDIFLLAKCLSMHSDKAVLMAL